MRRWFFRRSVISEKRAIRVGVEDSQYALRAPPQIPSQAACTSLSSETGMAFYNKHHSPRRIDTSRFWAVVIGIDAYKFSPLHGCMSDALFMEKCLTKDLGVLKGRIQRLTDA
ncbi:hypothetical protein ARMSODRAFT_1022365 [Armillaria solidipes]|uniref:Uncharacterized protein n=1 Tax=Armillaria solidipes TaxID=1076256 RepID=A0A2H3BGS3_9AGAR|nr:hypothetical protein ARMSODRAFT_1022365 [Armillaria solidipes]